MKKLRLSKLLCRVAPAIVAFAALAAFVVPASADTILFKDTFTYPNPSTSPGTAPDYTDGYSPSINTGLSCPGRQSGSLVDAGGPISYIQANHGGPLWNGYSGAQNGAYEVIQSGVGACFTPNVDFSGPLSAGGLIISYDAANWGPWDGDYANIAIGSIGLDHAPTNADPAGMCQWATPHLSYELGFGWLFGSSADGLWDSGTAVTNGLHDVSVYDYGLHNVKLVCTDSVDGNPFDGQNETDVGIYVDGVLQHSYVKGDGGYTHNYITLGGSHLADNVQEWDNLTVTQIPEPNTLVLLAMGISCLFWLRRRS
jgi:hypothetical protein